MMYRVLVPVLSLMLAGAAWAQAPNGNTDLTRCKDRDPAVSVPGCTVLIQSGADSKTLAAALLYRAMAYAKTLRDDPALADLDQALKLDPANAAIVAARNDVEGDREGYVPAPASDAAADPRDADFFLARGFAYMKIRANDRAIANFDQAIKLDPSRAVAFLDRGNAHEANSEFDPAIADYNQAIKLDPANSIAVLNRAVTYRSKGEYDLALDDFARALQLSPNYANALTARASFYVQLRQFDKAIADYDAAIRIAPTQSTYQGRGNAYYLMRDYPHAIADFTAAIGLGGDTKLAWLRRAEVYVQQRDWDKARADFAKAEELGEPVTAEASNYVENLYPDRAIARLDLALAGPKSPAEARSLWSAYAVRGDAHAIQGDLIAAIADYTTAKELNPASTELLYMRGLAWRAKEKEVQAALDFNQAIAQTGETIAAAPRSFIAWNERCWTRALAGLDLTGALNDCNNALKLVPNFEPALDSRGMVEFRMGQYDSALADYDKAVTQSPGAADPLFMRGVTKIRLGRTDDGNADIAAAKAQLPWVEKHYALYGITP